LDGHDTCTTYGENKIDMFSYKLHKSGLRTQVCIDINGLALFVSMSEACKDNNDGTMLVAMKIGNKIQEVDCIGLDGGYTQHIGKILEQDHQLTLMNFCFPIHKKRLQPLHAEEANFNRMFGAFRSMVENTFSELGTAFNKHNNKDPIRVNSKKAFNMNLRLCLLLLNIKKFVNILQIQELPHH
jgi:DDE superfamily endonuclease